MSIQITKFLNKPEVQEDIGVKNQTWEACRKLEEILVGELRKVYCPLSALKMKRYHCSPPPFLFPLPQLLGDWVHSFQAAAATVLAHGRHVVVYSGKDDYICNYLGGKAWVESAQWSGKASAGWGGACGEISFLLLIGIEL